MSIAGFHPTGPDGGTMELWPEGERAGELGVVRTCRVERGGPGASIPAVSLWFSLPDLGAAPAPEPDEPFLVAALVQAMAEGRDLVLHGTASAELLGNLLEFRDAWHRWAPRRFARIAIDADVVSARGVSRERGAGVATGFSGGVDSFFTLWAHASGLAGHRARRITHAAFVHGFDIPLSDGTAFEAVRRRSAPVLAELGVELVPMRTNLRAALPYHWEMTYGAAVAACLQQLRPVCGEGLIASSRSYDASTLLMGSNMVTDALLSSATFSIREDGAGHVRSEKIAALAQWPASLAALRVCWQGAERDRNCGRCEKCIRTAVGFLAAGLPVPACFDRVPTVADIARLRLSAPQQLDEWRYLLAAADRTGVATPEIAAARRMLGRSERGVALRRAAASVARVTVPRPMRRLLRRWVAR